MKLKQACEACWNDPETGWRNTDHGRNRNIIFKFYDFWGKDKLLRESIKKMV